MVAGSAFHGMVDGVVTDHGEQAASQDDLLTTNPVGERSKDSKERHAQEHGNRHNDEPGTQIYLQDGLEVEERVVLSGVPDHALSCGGAKERNQDQFEVVPVGKRIF